MKECFSDSMCSVYHTCNLDTGLCDNTIGDACSSHDDCRFPGLLYCNAAIKACDYINLEGTPCLFPKCGEFITKAQ